MPVVSFSYGHDEQPCQISFSNSQNQSVKIRHKVLSAGGISTYNNRKATLQVYTKKAPRITKTLIQNDRFLTTFRNPHYENDLVLVL